LSAAEAPQAAMTTAAGAPKVESQGSLISEAGRDFSDYQRLTSEGKLAEAGQKLDDLKRVLDKLNAAAK
jgi:hypothetical protein